jgi:hypothetical protein
MGNLTWRLETISPCPWPNPKVDISATPDTTLKEGVKFVKEV